ncbi:hypothetical protein ASG87_09745 [Frateuria sp. Soil773]|uniref:FecR family protein n=1 Tax=Frateuria sp. Soil773 TaxID=1736407 RepID=UPI0006FAC2E7|nr:FecR family protein [Frateuria sp. Soil773]KRE88837.1 hypothetical protein ASG87_09745 [Frateuria sp. Soil773]
MSMSFITRSPRRRWRIGVAALLLCWMGLAQAQATGDDAGDPPDRVARLSYLSGDLGLLPAGAQDWGDASVNRPLTRGDRLSSDADARAELEFGGGSLRMAGGTDVGLLALDDRIAQLELTRGTLNLTVRQLPEGQSYEIDTPTVALAVTRPGSFRVDTGRDGATQVTVFDGSAVVYGENNAQRDVLAGRSYRFGDSALNDVAISDIDGSDAFDAWCSSRDRRYAQSETRRYVSDEVVGYQDMDDYGDWSSDPDYGAVWYPARVAADWAPYRDGHWAYVAPWGWTWVDDAPWGFAPYHYGRWAYVRDRWGWIPGPLGVRPVYAPALVAFVGGGRWNVSLGVGGGAPVGWFPLGPGEVYNPWYRASRSYYTRVNITNIHVRNTYNRTVIVNRIDRQYNDFRRGLPVRGADYANRSAPRGFTAVPGSSFADARNVRHHLLPVDARQLAGAPVLSRGLPVRPTPRSLAPPRGPQARPLPVGSFDRPVVSRHAPPAGFVAGNGRGQNRPSTVSGPMPERRPAPSFRGDMAPTAGNSRVPGTPEPQMRDEHRLPPIATIRRAPLGSRPTGTDDNGLRPGELRSARFAHPRLDGLDTRREAAQSPLRETARPGPSFRSGMGYISNAEAGRTHAASPTAGLPQVPRIERAPRGDAGGYSPRPEPPRRQWGNGEAGRTPGVPRESAMPRTPPRMERMPAMAPRETARPYPSHAPMPRANAPASHAPARGGHDRGRRPERQD